VGVLVQLYDLHVPVLGFDVEEPED
jgi:hypothetical protein